MTPNQVFSVLFFRSRVFLHCAMMRFFDSRASPRLSQRTWRPWSIRLTSALSTTNDAATTVCALGRVGLAGIWGSVRSSMEQGKRSSLYSVCLERPGIVVSVYAGGAAPLLILVFPFVKNPLCGLGNNVECITTAMVTGNDTAHLLLY